MSKPFEQAGDEYGPFKLIKSLFIEELQCGLKIVEHTPSKAEIIHLENDDPENVFCLAFRTLPENSNGVAHILEHTVLCGSKKFPVKDPFFSMNRRSMNTYMNALTAPDFTCYPAASQVRQDFYNLLEVYLDAVFDPELKELSFLQEGHRLEFTQKEDPSSPLIYRGIVYNEMKGALSSPISRLWQSIMSSLFPQLLYRHNFGGDPKDIPTLSYAQLLEFHQKYYQESRCSFYFYGDIPLKSHLDFLEKQVLKKAKPYPKLFANPFQKPLTSPKHLSHGYPVAASENLEEKTYLALSWLTTHLSDQKEVLALHVLDLILMGTDASPLKYEILKSKLCHNVFSNFEDELSQVPYSLIFEGCQTENTRALEKLTFKKLQKLAQKPFKEEWIEAALHQLEFSRSEISGDYGPFGLYLILKMVPLKNVEADIENNLKIHSLFKELKKELQDPHYLPHLIKKHFLDNTHFSFIEMKPDPLLNQQEEQEEKRHLEEIKSKLTEGQSLLLIQKAKELEDFQNKQEHQDLEVLPKIKLKDIPEKPKELSLGQKQIGRGHLYYHTGFTNDIVYLDVVFKLPKIDFVDLSFVKLFTYLIPQMGTKQCSYEDHLRKIQLYTGGISCFLDTYIPVEGIHSFSSHLVFQGKALARNKEKLTELLHDLIIHADFQHPKRLKELISQLFVELDQDLKNNALKYALNLSYCPFSMQSTLSYYWSGLGYYQKIKHLNRHFDQEVNSLIEKLNQLKSQLLHNREVDLVCSTNEGLLKQCIDAEFNGLSLLPEKDFAAFERNYPLEKVVSQGRVSSSPVFFTAFSLPTEGFRDPSTPLLSIAAKLFDNTLLHKLIREQGGAYGGGASNRMGQGKFSFYAYRDPNLFSTVEAFHQAVHKITQGDFNSRELEEAKLGVLQKLDHPILPEYKAYTGYVWHQEGKTFDFRSKIRQKILNASQQDIQNVVREKIEPKLKDAILVTFSSKENLEKENQKLAQKGYLPLKIESI